MPFGKWENFDACVADIMKTQGKDEETARKICGALQARFGKESFSWVGDIRAHEKNLIRGKAMHPIITVHPEEWPSVRVYLEEELQKAAHSLAGQPLLLDHMYPIDGKVVDAKYEDGAIEYVAELNDERVLNWVRDGTIRHCSVEYDWSSLVKVNGAAPKGLQFTGLALLKNFEPGDPGSNVEVWESIIGRLKEAKLKEQGEPQEFIYYSVRDPAAFLEDRFSATWIDKVNGIQGIYGRLRDSPETPQPVAILFMRANGWNRERVDAWLRDHPNYVRVEPSTVGVQQAVLAPPSYVDLGVGEGKTDFEKLMEKINRILKERIWTKQYINDLDDSAFAIILPGGTKEDGKTVPRSLRKFPHHNTDGSLDLPHLRNANARLPQSDLSTAQKARAAEHLNKHKKAAGIGVAGEEEMIRKWQQQAGETSGEKVGEIPEVSEQLETAPEPTLDEVIQAVEDALEEVNNAIDQIEANFQALQPQLADAERFASLENQLAIVTDQKKALQEAFKGAEKKIESLEKQKVELTKKLGEAVIDFSEGVPPRILEGYVCADEILAEIPRWIPSSYGYAPYKILTRIRRKCETAKSRSHKVMDKQGS